jgi:transcriptional regulator with XRE-family HTH domain
MRGARRTALEVEIALRLSERRTRLGGQVRTMRRRRRWSQEELGRRAGLERNVIGRLERGEGRQDLDALERVAYALQAPLRLELGRDPQEEPADAGHLGMQELVLRLGRASGFDRRFELATRPAEPWRSIDVALGSERRQVAVQVECWNTFGDIGSASRSSTRKQAELDQLAVARWGAEARAALVWVVRESARNRALLAKYPEVFATGFPGSSRAWVAALTAGGPVPKEPGLVWCDVRRGRLFAWRRPG